MVKSHDTVAHEFAHQAARNNRARGFNMFYDGDTLYSYGAHFPIARFTVRSDNGETVLLFTTRTASVSTAKHLGIARRACSHLPQMHVDNVNATTEADHAANADEMARCFQVNLERAARRRNASYADFDLADAERIRTTHAEYCAAFGVDRPALVYPEKFAELRADIERRRAEQAERGRVAREKRDREAAERMAELLPRWRAGERVSLPYTGSGVYLLRVAGENVETSGGARFPVSDALAAYPLLCRLRKLAAERGSLPAMPDGRSVKLGHYRIDHVNAQGVRAGCHFIEWSEIDRVAGELGA